MQRPPQVCDFHFAWHCRSLGGRYCRESGAYFVHFCLEGLIVIVDFVTRLEVVRVRAWSKLQKKAQGATSLGRAAAVFLIVFLREIV